MAAGGATSPREYIDLAVNLLYSALVSDKCARRNSWTLRVEYRDLGADHFARRDREKMIQRLVRRINDLGCDVQLLPQVA